MWLGLGLGLGFGLDHVVDHARHDRVAPVWG